MFEWMAEFFVTSLIRMKKLEIDEREEYEYGVEVILLNFVALLGCFFVSMFFHQWIEYVLFLLFFIPVRTKLGGIHLKKSETCMITSITIYAIMLLCIRECRAWQAGLIWINVFIIAQVCIAVSRKPLKNDIQQLTREQQHKNKLTLIGFIVFYCLLFLFFVVNKIDVALACEGVFIQVALLLFWIEKIRGK